jgi:hypothetical protein
VPNTLGNGLIDRRKTHQHDPRAVPDKSAAAKLLIKPKMTLWLSDQSRAGLLSPLPDGVQLVAEMSKAAAATLFAGDAASLAKTLQEHRGDLRKPTLLWVAYRKGNVGDLNRDSLWPLLTDYGMRPVTQVAIDDVWSALRFRELKPGEKWPPGA